MLTGRKTPGAGGSCGPAVLGRWAGSLAYAPRWSALALAVGAILQVVIEVTAYLLRSNQRRGDILLSPPAMTGFLAGLTFMYATAALIRI